MRVNYSATFISLNSWPGDSFPGDMLPPFVKLALERGQITKQICAEIVRAVYQDAKSVKAL